MHWTSLGHAMWLAEAAGLRLLFDPLLAPTHHGGVFEVVPRREVHAEALRPDFVLVSHRHPDHFDVPSLHRLARLDPETVLVTPDPLVQWAARRLGFSVVHLVPPGQRIALDGVQIVTTPSLAAGEWGAMVAADGAAVWNQVDTVLRGPADVVRVRDEALASVDASALTLALVRWNPMLEIAAPLGRATTFPYRDYGNLLREIAALDDVHVVPASCGGSHVGPFAWMDRHVFPVTATRFATDLARLSPQTQVLDAGIGARIRVMGNDVGIEATSSPELVMLQSDSDPRAFHPLSIPALTDPNPGGHAVPPMRAATAAWIEGPLADALARAWPRFGADAPLRFVVSVVFPDVTDAYTITVDAHGARCSRTSDPEWDLLNQIAGSLLWEVIDGRRNWGDVLLAGALRARTRAYRFRAGALTPLDVGETFLYYALSYDDAVERSVRWEVEQLTGR